MTFKDGIKEKLHRDLGFGFYRKDTSPVATFRILAKGSGVLCGMIFVPTIITLVEEEFFLTPMRERPEDVVAITAHKSDGDEIHAGEVIATLTGNAEMLLKAERTICDYLSRLSGIATYTARRVASVADTRVVLLDTRKQSSIDREENKYAIRVGGGGNHRAGFFDGILIKDNDIALFGGVTEALSRRLREAKFLTRTEVEVRTFDELHELLGDGRADAILLDNMSPEFLETAVTMIRASGKPYLIEASGVGDYDIAEIAKSGVTHISLSALVTEGQARKIDISMKIVYV